MGDTFIEERLLAAAAAVPPGQRSPEVTALIDDDLSIWAVLLVSAGIPTLERSQAHLTGVLPALNSLVEKMQHPALAARLRQELQQLQADLPSSLLSYDELLAYLVWLTGVQARDWAGSTDGDIQADIHSAVSAFLGFLQQARVAHERCQALLPKQWTAVLKARQQKAMALVPWLQQQQQRNNDSWQLLGPAQNKTQPTAGNPAGQLVRDKCNGCSNLCADLRLCGRCKQVQYCR
ncbi:hypothetical protein N2152v2_007617 [Parachlorella kessleri]